jgi:gamma-glutamyltranspeptidase/glutathione hydrolase
MTMDGKRPTIASMHGMVAASHPLAAQAGARLLALGGNAFDAAAATAAALNVVEPFFSGLAGMGMATCYIAAEKRVRTLDFVTRVPSKFPTGRFTRRDEMYRGPLACGTPGNLAGWCELVKSHGRRKLADVFAPAIALARDGHMLIHFPGVCVAHAVRDLASFPFYEDWRATYLGHGGGEPGFGYMLRQPELARTFEIIAAEGPEHFHRGALGRQVVQHVQSLGGCLTMEDMGAVSPVWLDPLAADYRGLRVHTLPPPCEGFQFLLTLRILEGFDLKAMEREGIEHLDVVWRAIRLAAGMRIAHNKPGPAALARMLSEPDVETLRAVLRDPRPVKGQAEQWAPREPDPAREHTTSFSVADREGNLVCITQSLGAQFGCGVVVPGTGICLNNFLYWGEVDTRGTNPLIPGTDLALPMAPAIATRADKPVLALGTPGSYGICQTQAQALVQHVDFGLPLQQAIEAPRARLFDGARVVAEGRLAGPTLAALRARGHEIEVAPDWSILVGGMQGIAIDPDTGAMEGGRPPPRGLCRGSLRERDRWTAIARLSRRAMAWWPRRIRWPPPPARASWAAAATPSTPRWPPPPRSASWSRSIRAWPGSAWRPAGRPATSASAR